MNVNPWINALLAVIGKRYDKCSNFAGVATQETATANADIAAHNWVTGNYLTALSAETDAYAVASPNSRQLIYQNFGGNEGDVSMDKYLAYAGLKIVSMADYLRLQQPRASRGTV